MPTPPYHDQPAPLLRLKIQDLSDAGARSFLSAVDAAGVIEDAVRTVLDLLYPGEYGGSWPGSRSVTLVLRSFEGVAYTQGKDLDDDHKEIHFSTDYIASIKPPLLKREITGVIVHEMVHCWQWNGCGTAPGGLIEGFADWVRLRADLSPPHWKRTGGDHWDAGYQITAWFLDWLEGKYGSGTVPRLNHMLKDIKYEEEAYWGDQSGVHGSVQELWKEYKKWLSDKDRAEEGEIEKEGEKEEEGTKEDTEGGESPSGAVEKGGTAIGQKDNIEKGKEKAVSEKDTSERRGSQGAESELDNGWTELSSGDLELKRRNSELVS